MAFRGQKVWLWRWRRNPLKRRADTLEAWVLLGAWAITLLVGVFTGWAAAGAVEHELARERATWRPLQGLLTEQAPGKASAQPGAAGDRVWAKVRWTAPDGSSHTGQVRVDPGSPAYSTVTLWTDPRGHLVTEPADPDQARVRAALVGVLAGCACAAVPFVGGRLLRGRLERRRVDQWDADWARFDPLWGRRQPG
ncbi:hypothetical protein OG481_00870 [Streptomyces longwoodensis]|uniref:Rv1733c family protein n=1 Tax=Streptomyces longwoodensis TaxID=68231 RepID=UPI002DD9DF10|nr:hypothetical protein [Streptomyces longwoodensis]WRY87155.1 hypothetical protein OG481_00870 [Streptomyces longwoodensis]WUC74734.1 hypothetical protein OG416_29965 [Streptomyces longwoodensis]